MVPKYANIFMAEVEKSLLATLNRLPMCYFRFLDDIFMIWTSGQESLNEFLNLANDFYPSIKFTTETTSSEIHFLNTTIHLQNNKVETEIYSKPIDAHLYLLPKSCHPSLTAKNIPYSLARRIKRICSTEEYFEKLAQILKTHLTNRKYSVKTIDSAIQKTRNTSRSQMSTYKNIKLNSRSPIFTTTFHPCLPDIKSTFKHFNYIKDNNDNLALTFKEPPLITYRRGPTLGTILSETSLTQKTQSEPGFCHCDRPNCSTCKHSTCKSNFTSSTNNNKSRNILRTISCDSTNIIYLITYSTCNKQYIGETERKLK